MDKSLSMRIAVQVKNKSLCSAQNRATFLALREDIKQALQDGWPVKTIWQTLYNERKITYGYQTFLRYVNRLIPALRMKTVQASTEELTDKTKQKLPQIPGFTFQPNPDKKDLL